MTKENEEIKDNLKFVKPNGGIDVDAITKEAQRELDADAAKEMKKRVKELLKKKADAEKVVKNIDREIEDLQAELAGE